MRKMLMFVVLSLAAFGVVPADAGVKLTQQQVTDVCGKKLQSNGGAMGCTKACGLNGEQTCDFGCYKGKCEGRCLTCGVKERTGLFGGLRANRVVRQTVKAYR
jgi:hypothetical protein